MSTLSTLLSSLLPKPIPPARPKAMGLNSNVSAQGTQYHIQTEDLWPVGAQIVTHVFAPDGRVVRVFRVDYTRHLDKPHLSQLLPKVMSAFHGSVLSKIARGQAEEPPHADAVIADPGQLGSLPNGPESFEPLPEKSNVRASQPSNECLAAEFQPEQESGTYRVAASTVWDHLVEEAQRNRQGAAGGDPSESRAPYGLDAKQIGSHRPGSKEASNRWALAVQASRQHPTSDAEGGVQAPAAPLDPALDAYESGLEHWRRGDGVQALVHLARAVELEPKNARYRASLRRVLDWL